MLHHRLILKLLDLIDEELSKILATSISDTRFNRIRNIKVSLLNISSELNTEFAWIRTDSEL
jgi:hypothetical protein